MEHAIRPLRSPLSAAAMKGLLRLWNSPTFTTWASLAVRLGALLVILPLVLIRFAPADVALWQLFSTLFILSLMLDMGLAPTFARVLAFARGGAQLKDMVASQAVPAGQPADPAVLLRIVTALRWLYPRLAVCATLLMGAAGTAALIKPVAQAQDAQSAWLAWAVTLASLGLGLWGAGYAAALGGMNRIAELRRWEVLTGLVQMVSALTVLLLGGGLLGLVCAYQGWAALAACRNRWLLRRLHPELFATQPRRDSKALQALWPSAWRSGLGVLMSAGLLHLSGILYSQLAPAAEAAAYLIALRLVQLISQFCQAPFYSKLPRLAQLQASGGRPEQLRLAQRGMRLAYWVFVAGVLAVAWLGAPLLEAISSRTPFVAPGVWALLALALFAERFGAMHLQLYSLTNHIVWHIANGITGVAMLAITALTYRPLGVYSFPLAMLLAYGLFYCVYSATKSRRAFQLKLLRFEATVSLPAAAVLCGGLALSLAWPLLLPL